MQMLRSLEAMESRHRDLDIGDLLPLLDEDSDRAWRLLVEKYSRFVYSVALQLCRGLEDPEEWASEIYRRVFVRLDANDRSLIRGFRGKCDFRTYLYRIVRTERYRLFRRRGVEREAARTLEREADLDRPDVPEEGWIRGLGRRAVREALSELTEEDRRILVLRFAGGLKLRELVPALGARDVNDAAYRVRRALGRCRALTRARESPDWNEASFREALAAFRQTLFANETIQNTAPEVSDSDDPKQEGAP
jgi:RNA polymerase sigma-70 factor (ECF subfamily)